MWSLLDLTTKYSTKPKVMVSTGIYHTEIYVGTSILLNEAIANGDPYQPSQRIHTP